MDLNPSKWIIQTWNLIIFAQLLKAHFVDSSGLEIETEEKNKKVYGLMLFPTLF